MIKEEVAIDKNDYLNDLKQIKETIRTNQNKAMVVVNSALIMTYYEIGTIPLSDSFFAACESKVIMQ